MSSTTRAFGAILIGLALCGISAGITVADEVGLADMLNQNWFPTPAEQGNRIHDATVGLGSIERKLRDGVAVPLLGADGVAVGMFFSERGQSEAPTDDEPFMMFARDRVGRLHLYGFAVPFPGGMETFLFGDFPGTRSALAKTNVVTDLVR